MEFDLYWLLLAAPVVFLLGWVASRLDLRQLKREDQASPQAYFKGLNLLLNEQQDKAIDAFIEAVQHDPGTTDLHFALGNLFRRRGEYERAIRIHQHLLSRGDLKREERERAQHALAHDFMKAGLFDRAEEAFKASRALLSVPMPDSPCCLCMSAPAIGTRPSRWRVSWRQQARGLFRSAVPTIGVKWLRKPMRVAEPMRPIRPWREPGKRPRRRHAPWCCKASDWSARANTPKRCRFGTS